MTGDNFVLKATYEKTQEGGSVKKVTEQYLLTGVLSYSYAEERAIEELNKIAKWFKIESLAKSRIAEIHDSESGNGDWFLSKVAFVSYDEKSNKEKEIITQMLVKADDLGGALELTRNKMEGTMMGWHIVSISESKILDIFEYVAPPTVENLNKKIDELFS